MTSQGRYVISPRLRYQRLSTAAQDDLKQLLSHLGFLEGAGKKQETPNRARTRPKRRSEGRDGASADCPSGQRSLAAHETRRGREAAAKARGCEAVSLSSSTKQAR